MADLPRDVFTIVQKLRHEVNEARPDQRTVSPYITVSQAKALLRWIDRQQEAPPSTGRCGSQAPKVWGAAYQPLCALRAGHRGWHSDRQNPPCEWSHNAAAEAQQS